MRKFNKIFILLAFFGLSVVSTAQVVDSGTCGDNLTWELTGAGNSLTLTISGSGAMVNFEYSTSYPWAVNRTKIKTLIIGDSVTSIGQSAFWQCEVLTSAIIGNSVSFIGDLAFQGCSELTSVNIGNSVNSIGIGTFGNCSSLTFVNIPNSVVSIKEWAFYYCTGLYSISIGNSVNSIAGDAFEGCSNLTAINVVANNPYYSSNNGVLFNKNKTTLIKCPEGKSGTYIVPNSVILIGSAAFGMCSVLTSVIIESSVYSIDNNAFSNCGGLTSVTIGSSVYSIGSSAFFGCTELTEITSKAVNPPICNGTPFIYNVPKNIPVYVPCVSAIAYQNANNWNNFTNIQGVLPVYTEKYDTIFENETYNEQTYLFGDYTLTENIITENGCDSIITIYLHVEQMSNLNLIATDNIKIYPNPVKEELIIGSGELKINNVEICDLAGRTVKVLRTTPLQEGNAKINVSALPQGVFFVKIYTDKGVKVERVIKN